MVLQVSSYLSSFRILLVFFILFRLDSKFSKYLAHFTSALIFVVDCGDHDRIYEARDAIHGILRSVELRGVRVLVLANKQVSSQP